MPEFNSSASLSSPTLIAPVLGEKDNKFPLEDCRVPILFITSASICINNLEAGWAKKDKSYLSLITQE